MTHQINYAKLASSPQSDDIELVTNYFNDKCNCYSYAVQDYLAGHLSEHNNADFHYLPRPGQSRGNSYLDLMGMNEEGMRRAIHEDGINFAGLKYPKVIPQGHYVICCFLEPNEYHFIRQNRDGSWSSKDGRNQPTNCDYFGEPLTNPENYYHGDKDYKFIGYFFVPEGGIRVGVRAYETNRLRELEAHTKNPKEEVEKEVLKELVAFSDEADRMVTEMRALSSKKGLSSQLSYDKMGKIWEPYHHQFTALSRKNAKYTRTGVLKQCYTRPKNAKKKNAGIRPDGGRE